MKKKSISILLTIVMLIGIIPSGAIGVFAEGGVKYLEYNTETGKFDELTCTEYTPLADGVTTWSGGWYVAPAGKLELGGVNVNGSAYLILTDGCELIVNGGIHINNGSSFTIYAQSEGEDAGVLVANGGNEQAGIGNVSWGSCGDITINGGKVTAKGGDGYAAAGIGNAYSGSCGDITINGGKVTAKGGNPDKYGYAGTGIGNAYSGSCGDITINGGEITAIGCDSFAGYGCYGGNGIGNAYKGGTCGKVIINGGYITAVGGKASAEDAVSGKPFDAEVVLGEHISVFDCVNEKMIVTDNTGEKNYCDTFNSLAVKDKNGRPVSIIFALENELPDNAIKYYEVYDEFGIVIANYKYIDFDSVSSITSETRSLTSGWYKVDGEVTIDASLTVTGDVHLILLDGCKLTVSYGVLLEKENSLSVYAGAEGSGQLIAYGKYYASNHSAGIGGYYSDAGDLTVYGGNITAKGDDFSAGIGGGYNENGGTVNIFGGSVTATGGDFGAGIGGGNNGNGGTVTVYGGSVTATGGERGAGIGGGDFGNDGTVTVYGGSVTATGGENGAGIGGGNSGNGGTVTVYGGNINAVGGSGAAGIGGGMGYSGARINISGGSVIAVGGEGCSAVGYGVITSAVRPVNSGEIAPFANAILYNGRDGSVINGEWNYSYINPVNNTAVKDAQGRNTVYFYAISDTSKQTSYLEYNTSTKEYENKSIDEDKAFGVGGLTTWDIPWYEVDGNQIIDGTVTVNGNVNLILKDGCKLEINGGILVADGNSLTVYAQSDGEKMGSLIATGDYGVAGIGGGDNRGTDYIKIPGAITINGGNITATGGFGAAGIGGGYNENGGTVTINGGNITAIAGDHGAGIGNGYYTLAEQPGYGTYGDGGIVTVNGGNITATGKIDGSGIGGGRNSDGNTFTMTGGIVSATGENGAGIGGGYNGYGTDFIFSGGSVTAVSAQGAGIGNGYNGGSIFGGHHAFVVADGTIIKAGDTSAYAFYTAESYAQYRNKYVTVHLHDYTGEYKNNGDGTHSRQCAYCDEFGTPENHTFVNHICACGATNEHNFTGDYVNNGDGTHSRKCTGCEELGTPEAHTWQSVDAETHKCTVCETVGNHTDGDKDGECDLCGYELCTHANTETVYEWNENYTVCTATKHCEDCNTDILTENATKIELIEDTHGANCKTMGKGHYEATFATLGTAKTTENGVDTTKGEHHYIDFVCEYCHEEDLEGAKADAIKALHEAAERSDDEVVLLIADNAENAVHGAGTVAEVLKIKSDTIFKINAIATVNAAAGNNPGKSVKRIVDGAKEDISSAESVEDVISIRDECLADIEKLTVSDDKKVKGITLSSNKEIVLIGDTVTLTATVLPDTAENKAVKWTSLDTNIATVADGVVTAKCAGSTVIIAETVDGGYKDFCLIRVAGIVPKLNTTAVVDYDYGIISGIAPKLSNLDSFIETSEDGLSLAYSTDTIGTGTIVNVVRNGEVVDAYTTVLFGDVNNDGVYDGTDSIIVNCLANGMLTKEQVGEAVYMAADCNHDGVIDQLDVDILQQAGVLLADVDQSKNEEELLETSSAYVEYLNLIDQTVEAETVVEDTPTAEDEPAQINWFQMIILFLSTLLEFVFELFTL